MINYKTKLGVQVIIVNDPGLKHAG